MHGQERKRREVQAKADKVTSDLYNTKMQILKVKKDAAKAKIEAVIPRHTKSNLCSEHLISRMLQGQMLSWTCS
jgi:hypothetical protein